MHRAFPKLAHPIIQAPLAGGPSTPRLAAAVSGVGGLGFVAGGYQTAESLRADIARTRELTSAPFGVNLFWLEQAAVDTAGLSRYAKRLEPAADRFGIKLGKPLFDDDETQAKLDVLMRERISVASFTFGCPAPAVVARLHERDILVWITVTDVEEALAACNAGSDALIVQGVEAGGHRGSFSDIDGGGELSLLPLLRLIARESELPLVATGGIADGAGLAAVLAAGAHAAQLGTAFLRCPEAATSAPHRQALARPGRTALTRAFTGRRARGIVNRFLVDHSPQAPSAYPHVHHLTAPLRKAARAAGDSESINLWAGEAYPLAQELPAAELVVQWSDEARIALARAGRYLGATED